MPTYESGLKEHQGGRSDHPRDSSPESALESCGGYIDSREEDMRHAEISLPSKILQGFANERRHSSQQRLEDVQKRFRDYTGADLAFSGKQLSCCDDFVSTPALSLPNRIQAAVIALRETKKYPPGFLGEIGLKTIAIADACISSHNDGYHPFSKKHGGCFYYGGGNGEDSFVASYYSDDQLPLTLHREIFRQLETRLCLKEKRPDAAGRGSFQGTGIRQATQIESDDLRPLKAISASRVLLDTVGEYAGSHRGNELVETAAYFLTNTADALVQIFEHSGLPGSQRIFQVLGAFEKASPEGPALDWFIDTALGRTKNPSQNVPWISPSALLAKLHENKHVNFRSDEVSDTFKEARSVLLAISRRCRETLGDSTARKLFDSAAATTEQLMRQRIQRADGRFVIRGKQDPHGINWTLRRDLEDFGRDADVLSDIAAVTPAVSGQLEGTLLRNLRLLASYYSAINGQRELSTGTAFAFKETRQRIIDMIPQRAGLEKRSLTETPMWRLRQLISPHGTLP